MVEPFGIGIIGCGNISAAYLRLAPLFQGIEMRACADLDQDVAQARASEFGLRTNSVDALLKADDIDIVVNLTIPDAHASVSRDILSAGKHVYSEKPLALSLDDGLSLKTLAGERGLRVGCAPDTFLGGAHQLARHVLDGGSVGRITAGTCHVMGRGMEHWHPNPDFFFKPGGGPILDIGPYYIANLIHLLGPVKRVAARSLSAWPTRTITSEPRNGETIPVETPTSVHALVEFVDGAVVTVSASWDVWAHEHQNMELYGTEGSLFVPDPNFFGGPVRMAGRDGAIDTVADWDHPLARPNEEHSSGRMANYRAVGLADMAAAIRDGRDHRCSLERTLHAVEVMLAILKSGEDGTFIDIASTCTRPDPLGPDEAAALMA